MLCTPPAFVVKIDRPTGSSHAGYGTIVLANGTRIELRDDGSLSPQGVFLEKLRPSDRVQACFVENASMTGARLCIVENVATKDSFYSIGIPKGGRRPY
jgi:hypothetical protein